MRCGDMLTASNRNPTWQLPCPQTEQSPAFDTKQPRVTVIAGQNLLMIFPVRFIFFELDDKTSFAKLNWRIEEPDGEFFYETRSKRSRRNRNSPIPNHDNEYCITKTTGGLSITNTTRDKKQPFAFVCYRGSNDGTQAGAWLLRTVNHGA
jgi:violaxanthin de-epoxidase